MDADSTIHQYFLNVYFNTPMYYVDKQKKKKIPIL